VTTAQSLTSSQRRAETRAVVRELGGHRVSVEPTIFPGVEPPPNPVQFRDEDHHLEFIG
jgi:hypothetical protein